MAYINLLPWREAQRKQQHAQFMTALAAVALLSFVSVFGTSMLYDEKFVVKKVETNFLKDKIDILEQRIVEIRELESKKLSLQKRMQLIEQLQQSRNLGTQIMDQIAQVVPGGVYLSGLEKKGSSLLLVGKSESNNRLSNMIREIEQSSLLAEPLPEFISAGQDQAQLLSDFKVNVRIKGFEAVQGSANQPTPAAGAKP